MTKSEQASKGLALASSVRLFWGFVGALAVVAVAKVFGDSPRGLWVLALLLVLIATSFGQALPAAAYNGFVSGLFYNFAFVSAGTQLSFHTPADWWREAAFIAAAVLTAHLARRLGRPAGIPSEISNEPDKEIGERAISYRWNPDDRSERSPSVKETRWTL